MSFSVILTKAKALLPVAVVGGAIAITIKLLTSSTPLTNNLLNVPAEEDIAKTEHEEILEEETKPEEEEKEEEKAEAEETSAEASEEESDREEEDGPAAGGDEEKEPEESEQKQEDEEPKTEKRAFKAGNDVTTSILRKLLGADEEQ